jgi:hypothetical protein
LDTWGFRHFDVSTFRFFDVSTFRRLTFFIILSFFRWIFVTGFRALLPRAGLERMQLIITDEDPKCYVQIEVAKQLGVFPNVKHRLCCWHKVNRNFTLKARSSTSTEEDKKFTRVVEKWLYSFSKTDIETREEEAYSMQQIEYFISHSGISEPLKRFTQEYWVKVGNYDTWTFRSFDVSTFR